MREIKSRNGLAELVIFLLCFVMIFWHFILPVGLIALISFCETTTDPSIAKPYKEFKLRNFNDSIEKISADLKSMENLERLRKVVGPANNESALLDNINRKYRISTPDKNGNPTKAITVQEAIIFLKAELQSTKAKKISIEKELQELETSQ